jgi:hypothetical protein
MAQSSFEKGDCRAVKAPVRGESDFLLRASIKRA